MTAERRHHLDEGFGVVLNNGQPYSFVLAADEPVETFCPFLESGFLERVAFVRRANEAALLEGDPDRAATFSLEFPERVAPLTPGLSYAVDCLYRIAQASEIDPLSWEEAFSDLGFALLQARDGLATGLAPDRARPATRIELTRRIGRAIDFIHDNLGGQLRLHEIAGAAALSPHHFHRLFRQAMRQPVHAYVTGLRLKRAARLLERTSLSVTDVCFSVGFAGLGSFSSLFSRTYGCAPSAWRSKRQDSRSGRL
jgi:AraC-like DNA-binding protein